MYCLIVHRSSYLYIKNVVDSLYDALNEFFEDKCKIIICESIEPEFLEDVRFVFIIGELFERFKKDPKRFYIYFNFSVVAILGNPFNNSLKGFFSIKKKFFRLNQKLDLYDAVLDFYPSQTRVLKKLLDKPVFGFVPWISPINSNLKDEIIDRPYDVCFVGTMSKRRSKIIEMLISEGCILSPSTGVNLEDESLKSRCILNIHYQRSNHLEIPRLMGGIATGTSIISETSFGIEEVFPNGIIRQVSYSKIIPTTLEFLINPELIKESEILQNKWYLNHELPKLKSKLYYSLMEIMKISNFK